MKRMLAGLLPHAPGTAEVYCALAGDGAWAVQTAQDGWMLTGWRVLARCRTYLTARPVDMGATDCRLYRGRVYGVTGDDIGRGS